MRRRSPIHGLIAEFSDLEELVHAARTADESGYRRQQLFGAERLSHEIAKP